MSRGDDKIVSNVRDPEGTPVILPERVWANKVLRDHPEMTSLAGAVLRTVAAPDHVVPDPVRDNRKRYFRQGAGPSRWLLVVVSYEQEPARIVTAFGVRKDPRSWSK